MPIMKNHNEAVKSDEPLGHDEARRYRRLAATINYLAADRPDMQLVARGFGRTMASPARKSWANLKRAARYLKAYPKVMLEFPEAGEHDVQTIVGYSDSDWAGCKRSRRSASGGIVTLGGAVLRSWSNRQATIARSSGEAEFPSATTTAAEMLVVRAMMTDLGWRVDR